MQIKYDMMGRISDVIFAENDDQNAFWNYRKEFQKEVTERIKDQNANITKQYEICSNLQKNSAISIQSRQENCLPED